MRRRETRAQWRERAGKVQLNMAVEPEVKDLADYLARVHRTSQAGVVELALRKLAENVRP